MEEEGDILEPLLRCRPKMSDRMIAKCSSCWRDNKLAVVILLFGLFWCSLAIVMIFLYMDLIDTSEITRSTGKVTTKGRHIFILRFLLLWWG